MTRFATAFQQFIAGMMPHAVIDVLEVVKVQVHDRHEFLLAIGARQRVGGAVVKQGAGRQAGQGVVLREINQALLGLLAFSDVVRDGDKTGWLPCGISLTLTSTWNVAPLLRRPTTSRVPLPIGPPAPADIRQQRIDVLPPHLVFLVPEHPLRHRVEHSDHALRIDSHDAIGDIAQNGLQCSSTAGMAGFREGGSPAKRG